MLGQARDATRIVAVVWRGGRQRRAVLPAPSSASQERDLGVGVEVGAAAPLAWLDVGFGRSGGNFVDPDGCAASGPVWKPERRLSVVLALATWGAELSTSLVRGLGVGVCGSGGWWVLLRCGVEAWS